MLDFSLFPFNFSMLLREVESRGIDLNCITDTDIIEAKLGDHVEYFINYITRLTPAVYLRIFNDKYYSKAFLHDKGISTTPGFVFSPDQYEIALNYSKTIGFPVVIKPVNGSQGNFVFANLRDENEFTHAFQVISTYSKSRSILVEKHFDGDDYRFLVIADQDIAVIKRAAPQIIGDGISSIRQLVDRENDRRMNPRTSCLCEIKIEDEEGIRTLTKQGLTASSILPFGHIIKLRNNANVSGGGSCENVLETVHPSYLDLARRIHSLFPGNSFTCIDLLSKDVSIPAKPENYTFCEFNSDPGFSLHELPGTGAPHYVVKSIVDLLFPETKTDKKHNINLQTSEIPRINSIEGAKYFSEYDQHGLVYINKPRQRTYQKILDETISNESFHDIIIVCSPALLSTLLNQAFNEAFKDTRFVTDFATDLHQTLNEYAKEFEIDVLEIHFQRRNKNLQPWHTDGTGLENNNNKFTVNIAETLSGPHGTLAIHNNDLKRNEYLRLIRFMDSADEQKNAESFVQWSAQKDALCHSHRIVEIPVGQSFLFTTGREYGLVHKPSTTSQWRLFMKARKATTRIESYLKGLDAPYENIKAPGFIIKNEKGWLKHATTITQRKVGV